MGDVRGVNERGDLVAQRPQATWSSEFGFLMAMLGSAVGLGNVWRFPYLAGENGGGAFVLIYLATMLLVGLPALVSEVMLGRMGRRSPIGTVSVVAERNGSSPGWRVIGYLSVLSSVLLLSYYSVVGGWTLKYFFSSLSGSFVHIDPAGSSDFFQSFIQSPASVVFWHAVFMGLVCAIVVAGVQKGVERSVSVMMPILFLILLGLIAYACTLGGFYQAVRFSLSVDFSEVRWSSALLAAIGQSLFSLGVGQGAMMMYGAYSTQDSNIPGSAAKVLAASMFVSVGASVVVFSFVFTFGLPTSQGPGLIFVTLPVAFGQMGPVGLLVGAPFFVLLAIAAVNPAISLLQPSTVWLQECFGLSRTRSVLLAVVAIFSLGSLSSLSSSLLSAVRPLAWLGVLKDKNFMGAFDHVSSSVVMPVSALMLAIFVGWVLPVGVVARALNASPLPAGVPGWFALWRSLVRYFVPAGILFAFFLAPLF